MKINMENEKSLIGTFIQNLRKLNAELDQQEMFLDDAIASDSMAYKQWYLEQLQILMKYGVITDREEEEED